MWKDVDDYCMAECASRQDEVNPVCALNVGHVGGQDGCVLPSTHVCLARESYVFG